MRAIPRWGPTTCRAAKPMTESITVAIAPEAERVRILAHCHQQCLLQAVLRPLTPWSLRVLPVLLKTLADYQLAQLDVVLCADESGTTALSGILSALRDYGDSQWPVGLAVVSHSRKPATKWGHRFDDLRQLQAQARSL
jgi:hypothetical protein